MLSYKEYLKEDVIEPTTTSKTMSLWHGGRLDDLSSVTFKKGKYEYGPGLYLTTKWEVVQKYSKGSRKLYMVTITKGKDADKVKVPIEEVKTFLEQYGIKKKSKDVIDSISKFNENGKVRGNIVINSIVNNEAVKPTLQNRFREFLIEQGIDYYIVDNPFGWHEKMVVLFNFDKIYDTVLVKPKDEIKQFDLPKTFRR
jgi:hypothetical protein